RPLLDAVPLYQRAPFPLRVRRPPPVPLFPYATLFRSRWGPRGYGRLSGVLGLPVLLATALAPGAGAVLAEVTGSYATGFAEPRRDRKSTRLNSSHVSISYAVFCTKKNTKELGIVDV